MEQHIREDKQRLRELEAKEREGILDSLLPMLNKCFRRSKLTHAGPVHEYACINRLPMVRSSKASVHLNQYQLPAIHFIIAPGQFAPYEDCEEPGGLEPVFWFETIFTGELPDKYKNGAYNGIHAVEWVEVDRSEFIAAMDERFREFKANLFSPTTPAW